MPPRPRRSSVGRARAVRFPLRCCSSQECPWTTIRAGLAGGNPHGSDEVQERGVGVGLEHDRFAVADDTERVWDASRNTT